MTKKEVTRDVKLTKAQVEKLNLHSAQLNASQRALNDYLSGVLDANEVDGAWDVLGIEDGILKLRKKG